MRLAWTIVAVLVFASLIVWVRGGEDFHIARMIPLLSGDHPGPLYLVGGLIVLLITANALRILLSPPASDSGEEQDTSLDEDDDWDESSREPDEQSADEDEDEEEDES